MFAVHLNHGPIVIHSQLTTVIRLKIRKVGKWAFQNSLISQNKKRTIYFQHTGNNIFLLKINHTSKKILLEKADFNSFFENQWLAVILEQFERTCTDAPLAKLHI